MKARKVWEREQFPQVQQMANPKSLLSHQDRFSSPLFLSLPPLGFSPIFGDYFINPKAFDFIFIRTETHWIEMEGESIIKTHLFILWNCNDFGFDRMIFGFPFWVSFLGFWLWLLYPIGSSSKLLEIIGFNYFISTKMLDFQGWMLLLQNCL